MIKIIQTKKTTLSYGINDSATTLQLDNLLKLDGTSIAASDIGDELQGTFAPGTSREEIFLIDGANVTVNSNGTVTITNVLRGRKEVYPYGSGGFATDHGAGEIVVFGNNPQLYDKLAFKDNDETIPGEWTFTLLPRSDGGNATDGDQLITYAQALALATGTANINRVVVAGNGGEVLVAGDTVYLDTADQEWKKTDANTAGTVNNVIKGIAQGAGTDGGPITNGVLLFGLDSNQTGMTVGTQYFSDTAGELSATPGTVEVTAGEAISATEIIFYAQFNQQLTENQQDALEGTSGTPSASNKFVTADDVSSAGASGKIVRMNGTAYPAGDGSSITNVPVAITETYPLGESFTGATTPQAAVIISDIKTTKASRSTVARSRETVVFGMDGANIEKVALKIIPRGTIVADTVKARIQKDNSPTNNVYAEIQTDSGGSPSGTPISNGTSNALTGSSFTNFDIRTFTFASAFTLSAGTTYWVVFYVNTPDSSNYYRLHTLSNANDTYASFAGKQYASSAWADSYLPIVEIVPTTASTGSTSSLWLSDANATNTRFRNVDGLVTTTGSAGATGTIYRNSSRVAGFTGLAVGATYYLSQTVGSLTTSLDGVGGLPIGKAYSTTQIDLFSGTKIIGGAETLEGTPSETYYTNVDGYFIGYQAGSGGVLSVKTGSSSTPTTIYSYVGTNGSFCVPIRAGEYFTTGTVSGVPTINGNFFIPSGRLE